MLLYKSIENQILSCKLINFGVLKRKLFFAIPSQLPTFVRGKSHTTSSL